MCFKVDIPEHFEIDQIRNKNVSQKVWKDCMKG